MRRWPGPRTHMYDNYKCEQWIWIEQKMPEMEKYRLKNAKNSDGSKLKMTKIEMNQNQKKKPKFEMDQ